MRQAEAMWFERTLNIPRPTWPQQGHEPRLPGDVSANASASVKSLSGTLEEAAEASDGHLFAGSRGQTPDEDDLRDNKKEGGRMHSFTLQQVQALTDQCEFSKKPVIFPLYYREKVLGT